MPLFQMVFEVTGDAFRSPRETQLCYLDEVQEGAVNLMTGRDFATLVRIFEVLAESEDGQVLEQFLIDMITPGPGDRGGDRYGALMQLVGSMAQLRIDDDAARDVLGYVSAVLDPEVINADLIFNTLADILEGDNADVFWQLASEPCGSGARRSRRAADFWCWEA